MHVVNRRRWLRTKRWFTAILALTTLASVGGLEGTQPVPDYAWVLLGVFGWLLVNITNDYVKQSENGRK